MTDADLLNVTVRDQDGRVYDTTVHGDAVVTRRGQDVRTVPVTSLVTLSDITRMFDPPLAGSTVNSWAARLDGFPRPVYLGHGGRRWVDEEVAAWHRSYAEYGTKAGTLRPEWRRP